MERRITSKTSKSNSFLFITANSISYVGDLVFVMVINLWVVRVSEDASILGFVTSISAIGLLVGNPIGGYLSDRINKKNLLIASDILSATSVLILYATYQEDLINYHLLIFCNFIISFSFAIYSPTSRAITPLLVKKGSVSSLNSKLSISTESIKIISPSLAALLMSVGYFDEKDLMLINLISFIFSLLFSIFLRPRNDSHEGECKNKISYLIAWERMSNLKYIIFIFSIFHFFLGGINVVLPFIGLSGENNYYGFLLGIEAFGAVIAGLTYRRASNYIEKIDATNMLFVCGFFIFTTTPLFYFYINMITIMFFGYFFTLYSIYFLTTLQVNSEENCIGKNFGILYTFTSLALPIGSASFGFVEKLLPGYGMSIIGFFMLLSSILILVFQKNKGF